jgi:hypothetical protein
MAQSLRKRDPRHISQTRWKSSQVHGIPPWGHGDGDLGFDGLLGYPTSFLISRDGKIVKKVQRLISYDELTKAIEGQL